MINFLLSHLCSLIVPDLCIFGLLLPLWSLNALGVSYTAVMGSQSSSKTLCSPLFPQRRIVFCYVHTSLCFTAPLLSCLSVDNWQKAFFQKEKALRMCWKVVTLWIITSSGSTVFRAEPALPLSLPGGFLSRSQADRQSLMKVVPEGGQSCSTCCYWPWHCWCFPSYLHVALDIP